MSDVNVQEVIEPVVEVAEEVEVTEAATVKEETVKEKEVETVSIEDIVSGAKANTPIGVQRRIDELTREKYAAKKEAEEWRKKAESVPIPPSAISTHNIPTDRPLPPAELEFGSAEEFKTARVKYEDDLAVWQENTRTKSEAIRRNEQEAKAREAAFVVKAQRMTAKYPDFHETVTQPIFAPDVSTAILSSDYGPEIGYYLAKNPAENIRLHSLDPVALGRELGRLEFKFGEASKRIVSSAPPPINPVVGNDSVEKDPSKMNINDWMAWNTEQELKKIQKRLGG